MLLLFLVKKVKKIGEDTGIYRKAKTSNQTTQTLKPPQTFIIITRAAKAPGPQVIPPPGNEPDPHK